MSLVTGTHLQCLFGIDLKRSTLATKIDCNIKKIICSCHPREYVGRSPKTRISNHRFLSLDRYAMSLASCVQHAKNMPTNCHPPSRDQGHPARAQLDPLGVWEQTYSSSYSSSSSPLSSLDHDSHSWAAGSTGEWQAQVRWTWYCLPEIWTIIGGEVSQSHHKSASKTTFGFPVKERCFAAFFHIHWKYHGWASRKSSEMRLASEIPKDPGPNTWNFWLSMNRSHNGKLM